MRISDWSSDVCSSDLDKRIEIALHRQAFGQCRVRPNGVNGLIQLQRVDAGPPRIGCKLCACALWKADDRRIGMKRLQPGDNFGRRSDHPFFELGGRQARSEEHTSELQSLMRISYAVFCLKKKTQNNNNI